MVRLRDIVHSKADELWWVAGNSAKCVCRAPRVRVGLENQ